MGGALVDSFKAGRFGDEAPLGLIEDGGVTVLGAVSSVEEDFPEVTSPLDWDSLDLVSLDRKLARERRRRFSKNGIMGGWSKGDLIANRLERGRIERAKGRREGINEGAKEGDTKSTSGRDCAGKEGSEMLLWMNKSSEGHGRKND